MGRVRYRIFTASCSLVLLSAGLVSARLLPPDFTLFNAPPAKSAADCGTTAFGDYSFQKFSPPAQVVQGESRPRTDAVLFRGIQNDREMNPSKFIRAVLGDTSASADARSVGLLAEMLLRAERIQPATAEGQYLASSGIENDFAKAQRCVAETALHLRDTQARWAARNFILRALRNAERRGVTVARYLDYESPDNVDRCHSDSEHFSNQCSAADRFMGRGEVLFSTSDFHSSLLYGGAFVYGFSDVAKRSIDLNYANFVRHNRWTHDVSDRDEFLTPAFVPSSEVKFLIDRKHANTCLVRADLAGGEQAVVEFNCYPSIALANGIRIPSAVKYQHSLRRAFVVCGEQPGCERTKELIRGSFVRVSPSAYSEPEAQELLSRVRESGELRVHAFTWER